MFLPFISIFSNFQDILLCGKENGRLFYCPSNFMNSFAVKQPKRICTTGSRKTKSANENLLKEIKSGSKNPSIEEITPTEFFEPLTKLREGASARETEYAERFDKIKSMLADNLRDVKVFEVGDD